MDKCGTIIIRLRKKAREQSMKEFEKLQEKTLSSEEIFDGKVVHLYRDTVELPNGKESIREVIRHIGAVAIVPITDDGKVVVERQFRYPLNQVITEIPAGKLDSKEEDRLSAAKRELEEETGYLAKEWIELGDFVPTVAYCDERITLYLARGLYKGVRHLDEDEFLEFYLMDLEDLVKEVMEGKILDGKTQMAALKAYYYLNKEKN